MSEPPDPLVGRRFYDFTIERKLAQGGMGAVYLLRHEQYPIRKVLKVILSEYASHPAIRERFEREAQAVARLKHPNIAKIDSVSSIDGQPCMLIPFLEGRPLDEYLFARGGRLPAHEVLHIATQIARALYHAHGEGIIHRDLKPGNVFVEPTEDDPLAIQVLDFGIAKQLNADSGASFGTQSGPLGTPAYMAVEQFEHAADVTPAADVSALATMIWEMATGRRPWTPLDARVLYHKQLNEPPEPPVPNTLSPAWEAHLRKALSPNPRLRPQSMPALVVPLAWYLPANPPHEPSGVEVLRKTAPRWLEESFLLEVGLLLEAGTQPNPSPPSAVPVWTPGVRQATPSGIPASSGLPGPPADTAPPHRAGSAYDRGPHGAIQTTLGSANGVISPRSASATRWKLALLGTTAAALSGIGIFAVVGHRDSGDATTRSRAMQQPSGGLQSPAKEPQIATPAPPTVANQAPTPQITPAIPPTQPTPAAASVPGALTQPAASVPGALTQPSASPPTMPRPGAGKPPSLHMRDTGRTPTGRTLPGTDVLPATAKPTTPTNGAARPPESAQGSAHKFDPNAAGGQ